MPVTSLFADKTGNIPFLTSIFVFKRYECTEKVLFVICNKYVLFVIKDEEIFLYPADFFLAGLRIKLI